MDYIYLRDMQFFGYHGVLPQETVLGQRFRATVTIAVDIQKAGQTDELDGTVFLNGFNAVVGACRRVTARFSDERRKCHLIYSYQEYQELSRDLHQFFHTYRQSRSRLFGSCQAFPHTNG